LLNPFTGVYENNVLENATLIERIYPNPTHGNIFIRLNQKLIKPGEKAQMIITGLDGKLVYQDYFITSDEDRKIELVDNLHGTYFLAVKYRGKIHTRKIIR